MPGEGQAETTVWREEGPRREGPGRGAAVTDAGGIGAGRGGDTQVDST